MLPEFDQEMANTRKVLERIPDDKLTYKPDPKSMTMGRLAVHVAEMVGWMNETINLPAYDIPTDFRTPEATSSAMILEMLDKNVAMARAALAGCSDAALMENWTLSSGGNVFFTMPRIAVVRSMLLNHVIHHRAQLTVYFRLTGIPVPGLYGPSADEQQAMSA
jgi:uncharacterized damage-inducible protein DinB